MSAALYTPGAIYVREHGARRPSQIELLRDVTYVEGCEPTTYLVATVTYPTSSEGTVGANERLANAKRLALCWNSHDDLLAALNESVEREYNPFEPDNQSDRYKRLVALRAKATGSASHG